MRLVSLWCDKRFCTAFIKTSAQCGFAKNCLKRYLQFLRGCKAAFYRWLSDGELIGTVAAFSGNTLPTGWLLCDGSAVSRTTYAALFAAVGTTYGSGDGSTTFALPNLKDKFIQGSSTAGTVKAAGLPNIEGSFRSRRCGADGAAALLFSGNSLFTITTESGATNTVATNGTAPSYTKVAFDASKVNSIYGNSSTVQPPALTMKYAIYTGVTSNHKWVRQS